MADGYQMLEEIGSGNFGVVYKAIEKSSGELVAIKHIDLEGSSDDIREIQQEISLLGTCSSPYVTRFRTSFLVGVKLWIVMEYLGGGSCLELLKAGPFPESHIAIVCRELLHGLDYLHQNGKIHRDIKAANILLSSEGRVKIADFGVAAQLTNIKSHRVTFVGTPFWMAPEVIQESGYDCKADIWSLGITALELANGQPPHAAIHPMKALFLIPKETPPRLQGPRWSHDFKSFVARCLAKDPAQRPTAAEMLRHKFNQRAGPVHSLKGLIARHQRWLRSQQSEIRPKFYQTIQPPPRQQLTEEWVFDTLRPTPDAQETRRRRPSQCGRESGSSCSPPGDTLQSESIPTPHSQIVESNSEVPAHSSSLDDQPCDKVEPQIENEARPGGYSPSSPSRDSVSPAPSTPTCRPVAATSTHPDSGDSRSQSQLSDSSIPFSQSTLADEAPVTSVDPIKPAGQGPFSPSTSSDGPICKTPSDAGSDYDHSRFSDLLDDNPPPEKRYVTAEGGLESDNINDFPRLSDDDLETIRPQRVVRVKEVVDWSVRGNKEGASPSVGSSVSSNGSSGIYHDCIMPAAQKNLSLAASESSGQVLKSVAAGLEYLATQDESLLRKFLVSLYRSLMDLHEVPGHEDFRHTSQEISDVLNSLAVRCPGPSPGEQGPDDPVNSAMEGSDMRPGQLLRKDQVVPRHQRNKDMIRTDSMMGDFHDSDPPSSVVVTKIEKSRMIKLKPDKSPNRGASADQTQKPVTPNRNRFLASKGIEPSKSHDVRSSQNKENQAKCIKTPSEVVYHSASPVESRDSNLPKLVGTPSGQVQRSLKMGFTPRPASSFGAISKTRLVSRSRSKPQAVEDRQRLADKRKSGVTSRLSLSSSAESTGSRSTRSSATSISSESLDVRMQADRGSRPIKPSQTPARHRGGFAPTKPRVSTRLSGRVSGSSIRSRDASWAKVIPYRKPGNVVTGIEEPSSRIHDMLYRRWLEGLRTKGENVSKGRPTPKTRTG